MKESIGVAAAVGLIFFVGGVYADGLVVSVPTNGVLQGYIVQKNGEEICRDPTVFNDFRGQGSFIVCDP